MDENLMNPNKETPLQQEAKSDAISNLEPTFEKNKGRSKFIGLIAGVVLALIIVVIMTTGTVFALIAYDKIPVKNPKLKLGITKFVMALPGLPKSPTYVLAISAEKITKMEQTAKFDSSFVIESPEIPEIIGSKIEMQLKGDVDFRDPKAPKMQANIQIAKDLTGDMVISGEKFFFKVNEIPALIKTYAVANGVAPELINELLNKWIMIENTQLNSEAAQLSSSNLSKEEVEKLALEMQDKVFAKLEKKMQMETVKLENKENNSYKIKLDLSGDEMAYVFFDVLDVLANSDIKSLKDSTKNFKEDIKGIREEYEKTKDSNPFKSLSMEWYIDEKTMLGHKYIFTMSMETPAKDNMQTGYPNSILGTFDSVSSENDENKLENEIAQNDYESDYAPLITDQDMQYYPVEDLQAPTPYPTSDEKPTKIKITGVVNTSNQGEDIKITEPTKFTTMEELTTLLLPYIAPTSNSMLQ
jgi:hypothetical protein